MALWALIWATTALLLVKENTAEQGYLMHYASGEGDDSKPPPQPFESNAMPSQLATLPTSHPLHPEPIVASTEAIRTYWPQKVQFHGHHHVRPMKKVHKLKPSSLPSIPPFISDEMTQAIFLEGPNPPPGSFIYPSLKKRSKPKKNKEPPLEPTANPSSSSTSTLEPDTTTYLLNTTLIDLTDDDKAAVPSGATFKDAASGPSSEGSPLDYLVPPAERANSEYSTYNIDITKKRRPPFKILRLGGSKHKNIKGPNTRGKGPTGPGLLFGESQRNQVFKAPPNQGFPAPPPPVGHLGPMPLPYQPVEPNAAGFIRYLFSPPALSPTTPFPFFPPFFGGNELQVSPFKPPQGKKRKQPPPRPYAPNFGGPSFFDANYNIFRPTTSTVIVPEQGWMPIANPNPQVFGPQTTPFPIRGFPSSTNFPTTTLNPRFPFTSSTSPISNTPTRSAFLSQQTTPKSQTTTTYHPSPSTASSTTQSFKPNNPSPTTPNPSQHHQQHHQQHQQKKSAPTSVEVVPSIETPPIILQNNPISQFNAEYFLQQALTQVRHQQHQLQRNGEQTGRKQTPTRRAFVTDADDDEVIYQNPVHGVYRDPYMTIHYPIESDYFQNSNEEESPDQNQISETTPSYYDFYMNNIPTTLPSQPKEVKKFHYMLSSVKPKVVHEKDRTVREKLYPKNRKNKEINSSQTTRDPFVVYAETTTPKVDELLATSLVTPRTLRGLRLGQPMEGERRMTTEAQKEDHTESDGMEVVKSQGGLLHEEIVHYHAPVRSDAQFL